MSDDYFKQRKHAQWLTNTMSISKKRWVVFYSPLIEEEGIRVVAGDHTLLWTLNRKAGPTQGEGCRS